jgi:hypothetical protein
MAAETAIVFGIVTGRVIVMPPKERFYLLNNVSRCMDLIRSCLITHSLSTFNRTMQMKTTNPPSRSSSISTRYRYSDDHVTFFLPIDLLPKPLLIDCRAGGYHIHGGFPDLCRRTRFAQQRITDNRCGGKNRLTASVELFALDNPSFNDFSN